MTPVDDELVKVRERIHKLNDIVQKHELVLHEHEIKYGGLKEQVTQLMAQTATRDQLDAAVLLLGTNISSAVTHMSLQIKNISDDLTPIKKAIYWVVALVVGTCILAGLAFLFRRPTP